MLNESASVANQTADEREMRRQQLRAALRPEADALLERVVEELVDLPDAQAFGAIEYTLRDCSHAFAAHAHQAGLQAGKKKGYQGSSTVCPHCQADARFVAYRFKTWLTVTGEVTLARAYYHCSACGQGHFPFDASNQLQGDHLSGGLRPLVCLAGTLVSFRDSSDDLLRRFCGLRLSASVVRLATEAAGQQLLTLQQQGCIVHPVTAKPWNFSIEGQQQTAAYIGLDAFSVPIQRSGGKKADKRRMLYTATLYTPDKSRTHYLVDFDLDGIAAQLREASKTFGLGAADHLIALSDAGNGLEEAIHRHFWDDLLCILDWYHASQHLHDYAKVLHAGDLQAQTVWAKQAKDVLYEQGGTSLLVYLRAQPAPAGAAAAEELRKLLGYFTSNEHRTDYPRYRRHGWDIGSGPTEAGCKVVGARLKGSGMRWLEEGAAQVAPLRALYQSGPEAWDAFWALAA